MENNKKRAAIYIRVSKEEKEVKWVSLEWQEKDIMKWINDEGYTINKDVHIFRDNGYSWARDDRPALNELMRRANNWEFDIVLVWKVDRFFRRLLSLLEYVEYLTHYWVLFKSVTQKFETTTSSWKMILGIFWVIWELERDLIRERTSAWKITKASKWYYVWWGKPKLWYDFFDDGIWIKLSVNKDEARLIKKIFDLYTGEKKSIREICKILTQDWELTKDDRILEAWWNSKKTVKWVWHTTNIQRILKAEMYTWHYYYGKTETVRDPWTWDYIKRSVPIEKLEPIECPSIINQVIFDKAQELLIKNKLTKNNAKNHTFAWLIKCWNCWLSYNWYKTTKKTISYKCKWRRKDSVLIGQRCKNNEVSEKYLIDNIWKNILKIFASPDNAIEKFYNRKNNINNNIEKLEKDLKKLYEKYERLKKWLIKTAKERMLSNNDSIFKEIEDEIVRDKADLSKQITEKEKRLKSLRDIEFNKNNLNKLKQFYSKKIKTISSDKKIEIIKELVEFIIIEINWSVRIGFKFEDNEWDDDWWLWKKPDKWPKPFLSEWWWDLGPYNWLVKKYTGVSSSTILSTAFLFLTSLFNPLFKGLFFFDDFKYFFNKTKNI